MLVELSRRQASAVDREYCDPDKAVPDSPGRRIRICRHACRVQRTMGRLTRLYGRQMANEAR